MNTCTKERERRGRYIETAGQIKKYREIKKDKERNSERKRQTETEKEKERNRERTQITPQQKWSNR